MSCVPVRHAVLQRRREDTTVKALTMALALTMAMAIQCSEPKSERSQPPIPPKKLYYVVGKHKDGENLTLIVRDKANLEPPYAISVLRPTWDGCQVNEEFTFRDDGTPDCGIGAPGTGN